MQSERGFDIDRRVRSNLARALVITPLMLLAVLLLLSPYRGAPIPMVRESVEIRRACNQLWEYLGNSAHASDWSVFVSHITPLNTPRIPDGASGSIRRSFQNSDETGMRWDEYFDEVTQSRRRLRIYNVVGAPLPTTTDLLSDQVYEPLGEDHCRLSFTLFFGEEPSLGDLLKIRLASYAVARIFRSNIENIKRLNEAS